MAYKFGELIAWLALIPLPFRDIAMRIEIDRYTGALALSLFYVGPLTLAVLGVMGSFPPSPNLISLLPLEGDDAHKIVALLGIFRWLFYLLALMNMVMLGMLAHRWKAGFPVGGSALVIGVLAYTFLAVGWAL